MQLVPLQLGVIKSTSSLTFKVVGQVKNTVGLCS
jgi:hypothetical protein